MSDQAEVAAAFGAQSDDDKKESFERSTLKLVLRKIGATAGQVRGWECELEEAFGWNWFNDQGWLNWMLLSDRIFSYDLLNLLVDRPKMKDPVVEMYYRHVRESWDKSRFESLGVIFKCYARGRFVACSWEPVDNFLKVRPPGMNPFYVTPLDVIMRGLHDTLGD